MNITKRSDNRWKHALVIPVLFSVLVFVNSTDATAQSKTTTTETKNAQNSGKKKDDSQELINELIREKILTGKEKNYYVKLSYDELVVNSKTMPAELHKRMREKYLGGNPRKTITYKVSTN